MSNVFEQAQQIWMDEMNYWTGQAREFTALITQQTEANVAVVRDLATQAQTKTQATVQNSMDSIAKQSEALRLDADTRASALVNKLAGLRATKTAA